MTILSPEQGTEFAARILGAIPCGKDPRQESTPLHDANRLRVIADLAALNRAYDGITTHRPMPDASGICGGCLTLISRDPCDCPDGGRYAAFAQAASDSLTRTAALYGVTP